MKDKMQQGLQYQGQARHGVQMYPRHPRPSLKSRVRRNVGLEIALAENDIVLVDGSSKHIWKDNGVRTIFARDYSMIDTLELEREIEMHSKLAAIIGSRNARTIPAVADEFEVYATGVRNQYVFLNAHDTPKLFNANVGWVLDSRYDKERPFNSPEEALEISHRNRRLYERLVSVTEKCMTLFSSNLVNIDDPGYKGLVDVIKTIDRTIGIKKSSKKGCRDPNFEFSHHDADERLVAAAYWISMFSDRQAAILTKDKDFFSLIPVTSSLLGAEEFLPDNKKFRQALHNNPVRLYYRKKAESCEELDTRDLVYSPVFVLHNAGRRESEAVRYYAGQFLKHFADYDREVHLRFTG